jgi:pyochelin biosynthesis protein PchC
VLRADYRLIETYRPDPRARVRCAIVASGGDSDAEASPSDLDAWGDATDAAFSRTLLPGGHFYLARQTRPLLSRLLAALALEPAQEPRPGSLP